MARASSAAVMIEQEAAHLFNAPADDSSISEDTPQRTWETAGATYVNGEVFLKGNPLKTTKEIRCGKCGLPRLLHPTDGVGARKPEPGVEYCKKRPFIDKPYHDVYGQTFVPEGPGRGKKKKDMVNPLKAQTAKEGTPTGSQDSSAPSPPAGEGPAKPIQFPHAKCHNCNTFLPIKRMNNHMVKCIGGGGRDSSRTALWKIQNGNGNGSQNGTPPPGSRHSTPTPGNPRGKGSPNKREAGHSLDPEEGPLKKKKLLKKTPTTKLKAPKMAKSASQMSSSNLSFEQKVPPSDDDEAEAEAEAENEDEDDGEYGSAVVEPKKKVKPAKKLKELGSKKKWLHGKGGVRPTLPPAETLTALDIKKIKLKTAKTEEAESESSQTLSSPN